jgi:hypothetical protein
LPWLLLALSAAGQSGQSSPQANQKAIQQMLNGASQECFIKVSMLTKKY